MLYMYKNIEILSILTSFDISSSDLASGPKVDTDEFTLQGKMKDDL